MTPVVLMGYLNPIEVMGYEVFAAAAHTAGVDGILTVDLPPEEADDLVRALRARTLDPVFLLAPTSGAARIERIAAAASGFIYYVSVRGVTGAAGIDMADVAAKVRNIRKYTALPVGVGFGINSPEAAARVAEFADAVIVGSALVQRIADLAKQPDRINTELAGFIAQLRGAMDKTGVAA